MPPIGPDPSKEYTEEELQSYHRWRLSYLIHAWSTSTEVLDQIPLLEPPGLVKLALTTQREARQREEARLRSTPRWQLLEYLHQFSDYRDVQQFWALRNATTKALINFVREVKRLNPPPSPVKTDLQDFFTYLRPKQDSIRPRRLSVRVERLHPSVVLGFCLALADLKGLGEEVPYIWCIDSKRGLLTMLKRLYEAEDFTRRSELYQVAKQEAHPEEETFGVKEVPERPLHYMEVMSLGRACLHEVLWARWPLTYCANGVPVLWKDLPLPFLRSMAHASMFHGGPEAWYRKHHLAYDRVRSGRATSFPPWDAVLDEEMDRIERELLESPELAAKMRESGLNAQHWVVTHLGRKGLPDTLEFMKKKEKHVPTSTQETPGTHRRSDDKQP